MKQSLQLKLGQHLAMTPQLQQAIRLLQLSTMELQTEVQEALDSNLMLESEDEAERSRLAREKGKLAEALARVEKQLENRGFLDRAPEGVVRATEERRSELQTQFRKVVESLERLG